MRSPLNDIRHDRRLMAYTAAAMYGAAAIDGAVEGFLPGDPPFAVAPIFVVALITGALVLAGPRIPRRGLALLGPLGVVLTAYVVASAAYPNDASVLYALPVLWTTLFFGLPGAGGIIACVGVAHGLALLALPAASAYPDRWVDVIVSVSAIAIVVAALEHRNRQLVARLDGEARTDPLTGLLNRRGFDERAAGEAARALREGSALALIQFDIDHFKDINDAWGHDTGDRVLAAIGRVLRAEARAVDVVARRGGEEFTALLPGSDELDADVFAERVRAAVAAAADSLLPNGAVRVSAGVAAAAGGPAIEALLARADAALYEAKRAGRDRVVVSG